MINVRSSLCLCIWEWEERGRDRRGSGTSKYFTDGMPAENSPGAMGEWSMWTGRRGQCQIGRWDTIGNDYLKCIVVTFANRS